MIVQRYNGQGQDMWPPAHDRTRQWQGTYAWGECLLRFYAVLAPGEDLTDYPPTIELTDAEWIEQHATVYGLDLDGHTVVDAELAARDVRDIPGYLPS